MYCRECGEVINNENAAICVKCGTKKGVGKRYCFNCGETIKSENAEFCVECGCKIKNSSFAISNGSSKNKIVAGLLAFFLGYLGIHRFYLGYNKIGIAQLVLTIAGIFTCGITSIISAIWAFVDCILIFMGKVPDANGNILD